MDRSESSQPYRKAHDHLKRPKNMAKPTLLIEIWKTNDYRVHLLSEGVTPKKLKNGTSLRADHKENTSLLKQGH